MNVLFYFKLFCTSLAILLISPFISWSQCDTSFTVPAPSITHAVCFGQGKVVVSGVSGSSGTLYFGLADTNNTSSTPNVGWQLADSFTSVAAGYYDVWVRQYCSGPGAYSAIKKVRVQVLDLQVTPNFTVVGTLKSGSCADGRLTISSVTGTAPMTFALVTSMTAPEGSPASYIRPYQTGLLFDSLLYGTYYVRGRNGCGATFTQTIQVLADTGSGNLASAQPVASNTFYRLFAMGCDSIFVTVYNNGNFHHRSGGPGKFFFQYPDGTYSDTTAILDYGSGPNFWIAKQFSDAHLTPSATPAAAFPANYAASQAFTIYLIDDCGNIYGKNYSFSLGSSISIVPIMTNNLDCDSVTYQLYPKLTSPTNVAENIIAKSSANNQYSLDAGGTWHNLSSAPNYVPTFDPGSWWSSEQYNAYFKVARGATQAIRYNLCSDIVGASVTAPLIPTLYLSKYIINNTCLGKVAAHNPINVYSPVSYMSNAFGSRVWVELDSVKPVGSSVPAVTGRMINIDNSDQIMFDSLSYNATYYYHIIDTLSACKRRAVDSVTLGGRSGLVPQQLWVTDQGACVGKGGIRQGYGEMNNIDTLILRMVSAPAGQPLVPAFKLNAPKSIGDPLVWGNLVPGTYRYIGYDTLGKASSCPRISDTFSFTIDYPLSTDFTYSFNCSGDLMVTNTFNQGVPNTTNGRLGNNFRFRILNSSGTILKDTLGYPNSTVTNVSIPYVFMQTLPAGTYTFQSIMRYGFYTSSGAYPDYPYFGDTSCTITTHTYVKNTSDLYLGNSFIVTGCNDSSASGTLVSKVQGGTPPYTYSLYKTSVAPANLLAGPQSSPVFNGITTGDVYYIVVNDSCSRTNNIQVSNTYGQLPIRTSGTTWPCAGSPALFRTTSIPGASYQWYYNGSAISGTTADSFSTPSVNNGDYYAAVAIPGSPATCNLITDTMTVSAATCGLALPISLIYFNVMAQGSTSLLNWATASEQNSKGFSIERSADGRNWIAIGFAEALSLSGSADMEHVYTVTDQMPYDGVNYYRLKQVSINGNYKYSNVQVVRFDGPKREIKLYPNPTSDGVTISGMDKSVYTIRLMNGVGQLISTQSIKEQNSYYLDLEGVSPGFYIILLVDANGHTTSYKLSKK